MNFLPVVQRELLVQARRPATRRLRVGGATVATWLVLVMLLTADLSSSGTTGSTLFGFLAGLGFLYCAFEGLRQTADCLSGEKRAGTLGLLLLTDLHSYDIVLGKLAATALNSFYALLALLPPLAIPLVLGGVTGGEFWRIVLVLLVALAVSVNSGLCVSALTRRESAAWAGSAVLTALGLAFPGMAFVAAFDRFYQAAPKSYWQALWPGIVIAGAELGLACLALPRAWQESRTGPWTRLTESISSRHHSRAGQTSAQTRALLLDQNPALWLASRTLQPGSWWAVVGLAIAGEVGLVLLVSPKLGGLVLLPAAVALHLLLAVWVAWLACWMGTSLRQSGMLELMLTSPLTVPEIVQGHLRALERLLVAPMLALFNSEWLLAVWAQAKGEGRFVLAVLIPLAIAQAVVDLAACATYGLWCGLRLGRLGPAWGRTVGLVVALPTVISVVMPCLAPVIWLVKLIFFVSQIRTRMLLQLRQVAAGDVAQASASQTPQPEPGEQLPQVLDR
jgi:hypothetical protein